MTCKHCDYKITGQMPVLTDYKGKPFTFCPKCRKTLPARKSPQLAHTREFGEHPNDSQLALHNREMAKLPRRRQTPFELDLANMEKFARGEREMVFVFGFGGVSGSRAAVVNQKLASKFNGRPYRILADNGMKVIAEAAAR